MLFTTLFVEQPSYTLYVKEHHGLFVYQYSKSWVFKLSLVFFTATVHLQHIGVNLANLLIFACKLSSKNY